MLVQPKSPKSPAKTHAKSPAKKKANVKHFLLKSIVFKDKILRDQIKFLIRSLGIRCVEVLNTLNIDPDFSPNKIYSTFSVIPCETGDVYNLVVDKNNKYLSSSCVVMNGYNKY